MKVTSSFAPSSDLAMKANKNLDFVDSSSFTNMDALSPFTYSSESLIHLDVFSKALKFIHNRCEMSMHELNGLYFAHFKQLILSSKHGNL